MASSRRLRSSTVYFIPEDVAIQDNQSDDPLAITDEYRKAFREKELKKELCPQNEQEVDPLAITYEYRNAITEKEIKRELSSHGTAVSSVFLVNSKLEQTEAQVMQQVTDPLAVDDILTETKHQNSLQKHMDEAFEGSNNPKTSPVKISNELLERFGKHLLNNQPIRTGNTETNLKVNQVTDPLAVDDALMEANHKSLLEKLVKRESKKVDNSASDLGNTDELMERFGKELLDKEKKTNLEVTDPLAVDDVLKEAKHQNSLQKLMDEAFEGSNNPETSPVKISNELLERFGKQLLNNQPIKTENKEKKLEDILEETKSLISILMQVEEEDTCIHKNDCAPDLPASGTQNIVERGSGKIQFSQTTEPLMENDVDRDESQELHLEETENEEEGELILGLQESSNYVKAKAEEIEQEEISFEATKTVCTATAGSPVNGNTQGTMILESVNENTLSQIEKTQGELILGLQESSNYVRAKDEEMEQEEISSEGTKTVYTAIAGSPVNGNTQGTMILDSVNENTLSQIEKTQINCSAGSSVIDNDSKADESNTVNEKLSPKTQKALCATTGSPVSSNAPATAVLDSVNENIPSQTEKTQNSSASSEEGRNAKDDVTTESLIKRGNHPSPEFEADEEMDSFDKCVFKCKKCGRKVSQSEFSKLRTNFSEQNISRCVECNDWVSKICLDMTECRASNELRNLECKICLKKFKHNGTLTKHKIIHTGEMNFECDICFKKFRRRNCLKSHQFVHFKDKPLKCSMCPKSFINKCDLINHLRTHTGDKPHKCDICSKSFATNSHLSRHKFIHSNNKVSCDICLKTYCDKNTLKRHIVVVHTREFSHKCATCGKEFIKPGLLKAHMAKHTGQRDFVCDICGKSFFTEAILRSHMTTHSEERQFTCDICSKSFNKKAHLKKHISTHYNKKKFQCDKCSKWFATSSNLKDHMLSHSEERQFKCDICNKAFKFKHHLGNHMLTH